MSAAPDAEPAGPVLTPDPDDTQAVPDGWEYHTNGTATVVLGGKRYRLRRPKAGEYRRLREELQDADDAVEAARVDAERVRIELTNRHLAERRAAQEEGVIAAPAGVEDEVLVRKARRALTNTMEQQYSGWMAKAFDLLCDQALPDDDDLPVWWSQPDAITTLTRHWQTVPPARGVR